MIAEFDDVIVDFGFFPILVYRLVFTLLVDNNEFAGYLRDIKTLIGKYRKDSIWSQ